MPTRNRSMDGADGYPAPNSHVTAARFRDRVRPDDILRGVEGSFDPPYSVKRMLDGRVHGIGPLTDAQSNPLCYPEEDLGISTDNSDWVQ